MSTVLQERHQPITAPKLRARPAQPATPGSQPATQGSQPATQGSQLATPRASVPAAGRPTLAPRAGWSPILDSIVATLREWRRRRAGRYELAGLDERTLRDIG